MEKGVENSVIEITRTIKLAYPNEEWNSGKW
jgi:hypothetical protein